MHPAHAVDQAFTSRPQDIRSLLRALPTQHFHPIRDDEASPGGWADGWLQERFHTRDRRASRTYRLPALEVKLGYRPLTAAQQRELRAQWLAARVILTDFAERRCCSREIVINVCTSSVDELISILCAAVALTDDEHLWRLAPGRDGAGRPVGPADHAQGARAKAGPAV
jgi:hypothetical protein